MLARLWAVAALLALACGGADNQTNFDQPTPGTSGSGAGMGQQQAGAATGGSNAASAGQNSGGTAAGAAGSSVGAAGAPVGGSASSSSGSGGSAPDGGSAQAGGTAGGTAGAGGAQTQGGAAHAGSGGQAGNPLDPKPAPGCTGYVDIAVPEQTCIWLHGAKFTTQSSTCDVVNPVEKGCATVTATSKALTVRVSEGVTIERFKLADLNEACSAKCQ
jgi:hypothetical protein